MKLIFGPANAFVYIMMELAGIVLISPENGTVRIELFKYEKVGSMWDAKDMKRTDMAAIEDRNRRETGKWIIGKRERKKA